MEQSIIIEMVKQVPALAVLAFIIIRGLQYVQSRDALLKDLGDEYHEAQRRTVDALQESKQILVEVRDAVKRTADDRSDRYEAILMDLLKTSVGTDIEK